MEASDASSRGRTSGGKGSVENKTCPICGQIFARVEHRQRHMVSHTGHRRFSCRNCGNHFQRADVLHRHIKQYCPRDGGSAIADDSTDRGKRARVQVACDVCHKQKLKCDGQRPCQKCHAKKATCTYDRSNQRRHTASDVAPTTIVVGGFAEHCDVGMASNEDPTVFNAARLDNSSHAALSDPRENSQNPLSPSQQQALVQSNNSDATLFENHDVTLLQTGSIELETNTNILGKMTDDIFMPQLHPFDSLDHIWGDYELHNWFNDDFVSELPFPEPGTPTAVSIEHSNSKQQDALLNFRQAVSPVISSARTRQLELWLKLPYVPRQYDVDVIERLLAICHLHLSPVFASFRDTTVTKYTLAAQVVAMAAFGALFTGCTGSRAVGRLLFTDSQRMVDHLLLNVHATDRLQLASLLKTMLVLELFGLCSGLKRPNETGEAFHQALIQTSRDYLQSIRSHSDALPTEEPDTFIVHDILILEAYRVILQQLQPVPDYAQIETTQSSLKVLGPCSKHVHQGMEDLPWPYHRLACIAIASHFATSHAEDLVHIHKWKPETIEIYMQSFANRNEEQIKSSPSLEILLRTNLWTVRSPTYHMQKVAFDVLQVTDPLTQRGMFALRQWRRSDDYPIVMTHVDVILDLAERVVSISSEDVETPHDAICTYLAILASWTSCLIMSHDDGLYEDCQNQMERGVLIMKQFRVSLATTITQILGVLVERLEVEKN